MGEMPLPIIADVYRVTFIWDRYQGVAPRNVINVYAPTSSETDVITAVNGALQSHQFGCMLAAQTCHTLSCIALDGVSAGVTKTVSGINGDQTGDMIPAACALVSLATGIRGPKGRGRVFIGPVGEVAQSGGVLDATLRGQMLTAWTNFDAALVAGSPTKHLNVASYKHSISHGVTSMNVETVLGTQRRRQQQLR